MRDVSRRAALHATSAAIVGSTLLGTVPTASADTHEPPNADEVAVADENVAYIEEDPDAGFHYPYFLYIPASLDTSDDSPAPIFVGPNNSPSSEDDYTTHLDFAKDSAERGRPRAIAERLDVPLLVPVFPRYRETPEPWYVYVQVLDPSTFTIADSPLQRVDEQLLEMVADATSRLEANGHTIASKIHIDGFSASGSFTNRFTILHPERVNAASHGGTTVKTLPKTELDDDVPVVGDPKWDQMSYPAGTDEGELPYPIGVANLAELTGCSFSREAWLDTPQYIYIGDEDRPEPGSNGHRGFGNLPPEDVQSVHPDDRPYGMPDLIDDIYGVENIAERFEVSRAAYENVGAAVTFTVYEGQGHTPWPAIDDLVAFHRGELQNLNASNAAGEDCSADAVEDSTTTPTATPESSPTDTPTEVSSTVDTPTEASGDTDTAAEATSGEVPGFGVGATLSALAGVGYMLKRRVESEK
jgi:hypothetical protein